VFATHFTADGAVSQAGPWWHAASSSQTLTSVASDGMGGLLLAW
jgi:hypothetical protein